MRPFVLAVAALALAAPTAQARQCYRRVVEPPRYATVAEEVMASPAREVADYAPPVTREVEETVVVRPERTVAHLIPAQYAVREETALVSPAHREWRVRREEGETIGCWVTVPARFARIVRRVLVTPAREVTETLPAETETRTRLEVVEAARVSTRLVPPRYALRAREVVADPGGARWAPIADCDR